MTDDIFDDSAKKAIDDRNKKRRRRELSDLKTLLEAVEGRRFFWRLICETSLFRSCYDTNALAMANKEGRRDIGIWVIGDIKEVSLSVLGQMEREALSDERSEIEERKRNEAEET